SPFNPRIRLMGTFRTKEDDVAKISTTVYVTNFPESLSAKELFNSCKVYGHVVDSFIPTKRAKNADDEDHDDTNSNDDGFNDQIPDGLGGNSDGEEVNENIINEIGKEDEQLEEREKAEKGGLDNKSESSLKYPPGFFPKENHEVKDQDGADSNDEGEETNKSKKSGTNEASCINIKYKEDASKFNSNVRVRYVDGKERSLSWEILTRTRFCHPGNMGANIQMEFPKKLSDDELRDIECDVTNDEIKRAVWDCGTDKAPGPDGFTFGFYRRFWDLIQDDVYAAVRYFFVYSDIPKGCNSSFISLIPKIQNANLVKDFRPISLIGSLYKIIAKVLANRLVGILSGIVNEVQSAFVADRQILDGPFILNEVIQWCKSNKKQALIFKVDFEKAYDSVRWDFLDDVLRKFGFGDKWCKWIQCCLRSSRGSIMVNGSPTEEFQFGKGLKQGDPLSPFLFILIMESLHISFQRIVDAGLFKGIKIGGGMVNLSHLFYADDAVFVGQWCDSNITTLVHVLECFHKVSGLRINMCKSKIMGVNVEGEMVNRAAGKLGCLVLKTPFLYLGSMVGGNMFRKAMWNDIMERVKKRLSKWKMQMLSIGGRLTLVKSVLGSMPIFYFSIFKVPMGVLRELENIRKHFFKAKSVIVKKRLG
ncbi:RNA-directed DNA polymerase, eukaryota, partial [Tanacetum coccineum]